MDVFVHIPFMYFPAFLLLKDLLLNPDGISVQGAPRAMEILREYKNEFIQLNIATCKFFIPSGIVMFGIMPMHLRIPYVACIGLIWASILSYMKGGDDEKDIVIDQLRYLPDELARLNSPEALKELVAHTSPQMSQEQFVSIFAKYGGVDEDVTAVFEALDLDKSGTVPGVLVNVLLALLAQSQPQQLFDVCDQAQNGVLSYSEVDAMLNSLITVKERTTGTPMWMYTIGAKLDSSYLRSPEYMVERQAQLYKKYPTMAQKNLSLPECIIEESKILTDAMFKFADKNNDKEVSREEFEAWLNSDQKTAKTVQKLYQSYAVGEAFSAGEAFA
jgi:Ca2+-binding EF-hand superfamily protein